MAKEKTLKDKVLKVMNNATWEEVREVGVSILARYVAFHAHKNKGFDFPSLMEDIAKSADKWVAEEGGAMYIAIASLDWKDNGETK